MGIRSSKSPANSSSSQSSSNQRGNRFDHLLNQRRQGKYTTTTTITNSSSLSSTSNTTATDAATTIDRVGIIKKVEKKSASEQLKFIIDSYESFNRVFFGEEMLIADDDEIYDLILPLELIRIVLDYCDQRELQNMLKTCKVMYSILRMDMYYWPQITRYQTFGQLVKYLESHDLLLYSELYTNVGQALHYTDLLLPVLDIKRKTEFKPFKDETNQWSLESILYSPLHSNSWENPDKRGTSSQLFAEEYFRDHDVYDVDVINLMINTLFKLRQLVKKYDVSNSYAPTRVVPNLRLALRDYRTFFHSHPRLKLLLRAREIENLELNGPIEQESREDNLPKPIDNSLKMVAESDLGKPIAYSCVFCKAMVGGFTCVNCNELLLIDSVEGTAKCTKCPSSLKRPKCCQKEMQAQAINWTIHPSTSGPQYPCKCSPVTCRCFACCSKDVKPEGNSLEYNGFYNRVWEVDVYTCTSGCKGQYYDGTFSCASCQSSRGLIMDPSENM